MPKFSIEIHEKRMRELLQPKLVGGDLASQLREFTKKRKVGEVKLPPIIKEIT